MHDEGWLGKRNHLKTVHRDKRDVGISCDARTSALSSVV